MSQSKGSHWSGNRGTVTVQWSNSRGSLKIPGSPCIIRVGSESPDPKVDNMTTDIRRRKKDIVLAFDEPLMTPRRRLYPVKRIVLIFALTAGMMMYLLRDAVMSRILVPLALRIVPPAPVVKPTPQPRYELRTSFANDRSTMIHQQYGTMMDACRILQQCFVGSDVYGTPEVCKRSLDPTIKYYDSGFWVEMVEGKEDRLVGFLSIHHDVAHKARSQWQRTQQNQPQQSDDYHSLILYNVCIDEERRGQGVAKKMIPAFIDAMIKHYKLEKYAKATGREIDAQTGKPIPPLVVGLDVDMTSDTMAEAFSLYAKLGFVRWWTPCSSVANHKWTALIDTQLAWEDGKQGPGVNEKRDERGNVKKTTGLLPTRMADFPLARLLWEPKSYLKNAFNLGTGKKPNHFCMYKFHNDSFHGMAKTILSDPDSVSDFVLPPKDGSPVPEDDKLSSMP